MSNKEKYGEVMTPPWFVNNMLDYLPQHIFKDSERTWLDPGAGSGHFSLSLYQRGIRKILMIDINNEHVKTLRSIFGSERVLHGDFLSLQQKFDTIVGNPPFNAGGLKKVPTNKALKKKNDGETIWPKFVRHAVSLLNEGGILSMIVPSIWMRPDRAGMYEFMLKYRLENIQCFSNTETNRIFGGECQTPTCFFTLYKEPRRETISLYDGNKMIHYPIKKNWPLPVHGASVIKKLLPFVEKYGHLKIHKTNVAPKGTTFSLYKTQDNPYKNIRTCRVHGKTRPYLVYEYTNKKMAYSDTEKLVLAHKMHGFPFWDKGLGISRRDNYVILENMEIWAQFLSTRFARYIFEAARYRMMYLERQAFQFIPDIAKIEDFPKEEEAQMRWFGLEEGEIKLVLGRRQYETVDDL